jgi:hypothetical protein
VGNLKPSSLDPKDKPAPFEFSFEGLSDEASKRGFSIEPMKGAVEAGGTKEVLVSFAPNPDAVRGSDRTRTATPTATRTATATANPNPNRNPNRKPQPQP